MANVKLGEILVKANVLVDSQLKSALAEQQRWGGRLGDILVRMSLVTEEILVKALSWQLAIPLVNLDSVDSVPAHVLAKLPIQAAKDLAVLPLQLRDDGKTLVVAMGEPQNVRSLDTLRALSKCRIVAQIAGRTAIAKAQARFYEGEAELAEHDGAFKVLDAQGNTVIKATPTGEHRVRLPPPVNQPPAPPAAAQPPAPAPALPPPPRPTAPEPAAARPAPAKPQTPSDTLASVEEMQRREVGAIKAMVDLLIQKGVFTREEYLAKVKR